MFKDRFDAAHQLAHYLKQYANNPQALILAIPRGGLELGYVLARELHLPLDIILTKKIGYPGNPEYAIGAVSLHHVYVDPEFTHPEFAEYIVEQSVNIRALLQERAKLYYKDKKPRSLANKIVIVVDDGVATGSTLLATIELIRQENPHKIIIALPVAPREAFAKLQRAADEVVCLQVPELFFSVGQFYQKFNQVEDQEAIRLFHEANQ